MKSDNNKYYMIATIPSLVPDDTDQVLEISNKDFKKIITEDEKCMLVKQRSEAIQIANDTQRAAEGKQLVMFEVEYTGPEEDLVTTDCIEINEHGNNTKVTVFLAPSNFVEMINSYPTPENARAETPLSLTNPTPEDARAETPLQQNPAWRANAGLGLFSIVAGSLFVSGLTYLQVIAPEALPMLGAGAAAAAFTFTATKAAQAFAASRLKRQLPLVNNENSTSESSSLRVKTTHVAANENLPTIVLREATPEPRPLTSDYDKRRSQSRKSATPAPSVHSMRLRNANKQKEDSKSDSTNSSGGSEHSYDSESDTPNKSKLK